MWRPSPTHHSPVFSTHSFTLMKCNPFLIQFFLVRSNINVKRAHAPSHLKCWLELNQMTFLSPHNLLCSNPMFSWSQPHRIVCPFRCEAQRPKNTSPPLYQPIHEIHSINFRAETDNGVGHQRTMMNVHMQRFISCLHCLWAYIQYLKLFSDARVRPVTSVAYMQAAYEKRM